MIDQLLVTAKQAASAAAQVIRERYDLPRTVRLKGPNDLVTDTDTAAQDAALRTIREAFPDHAVLAEEDPSIRPDEHGVWPIPDGICWIVDPLDGTTNYTNRIPFVCVSVGVTIDQIPVAGVIVDPLRAEMFSAAQGQGAMLNGSSIRVQKPVPLHSAVIGLGWAYTRGLSYHIVDVLSPLARRCRTTRALGAAALGLSYVAVERLQLYFNLGLKPWDVAAAAVILSEAGCEIRQPTGAPWHLGIPMLMAAHPTLLDEAVTRFVSHHSS
ncbi:MAG: inositol monophosphatase [Chloroflexi bacterium]|nr:inositol monophosphatase [Chloroflexota bacterium]